jgi:hypothetical protein
LRGGGPKWSNHLTTTTNATTVDDFLSSCAFSERAAADKVEWVG